MKRVSRLRSKNGFTLIEVTGALAVLSFALPAIAYLFILTAKEDSRTHEGLTAHFLATSILNEMSQRRFRESVTNPAGGPSNGEVSGYDRRNFDDISDYRIFSSTWGALNPPRDETGTPLSNYSQFSQYIEIINIAPPGSGTLNRSFQAVPDGSSDFKLVTVTVTWDKGKSSITESKIFALNP